MHHELLRFSESYTVISGKPITKRTSIDWHSNFGTGYEARRNLGPLTLLPSIWAIRNNSYDIVVLNDVRSVYTYEVAETKVTQVVDYARKNQHPLQCTLEKD